MKTLLVLAFSLVSLVGLPSRAQESPKPPTNPQSRRIQNIAPEEMWKRVTQCAFPTYPPMALSSQITGMVELGLGVSPAGDVGDYRVLHSDDPLLTQSAVDAISQWRFNPNMVQGEVTWSRIRALVHFNADGSTAIDLEHAILPDNFGDPGTPASAGADSEVSASVAVPRPETVPACISSAPVGEGPRKNPKLSSQLAELAQAIPQRSAPPAPGEEVAPPKGFSVEKLTQSVQDAIRAGKMRINEKAEVQVYIEMTEIYGSNLTQLSFLGATPQRVVLLAAVPTVQALLPITMINQVSMPPFVRYIRLPD